jgi:hypothetical protein
MVKLQYVVRGPEGASAESFRRRVVESLVPRLLEHGPARLKVTLTTRDPPRLAVVPYARRRVALVSLWESRDPGPGRGEVDWASLLVSPGEELDGYLVRESVPLAVSQDWPDGQPTPGVVLLTLFRRRRGLSDAELIARWHGEHTPMTLRNQPNWGYVRNVVEAPVVEGSPPLDGIVEEHFREPADLFDPVLFFGGAWSPSRSRARCALRMAPHMAAMLASVNRFLDLRTLETYLAEELIAKS